MIKVENGDLNISGKAVEVVEETGWILSRVIEQLVEAGIKQENAILFICLAMDGNLSDVMDELMEVEQ